MWESCSGDLCHADVHTIVSEYCSRCSWACARVIAPKLRLLFPLQLAPAVPCHMDGGNQVTGLC